jgi:formylglycine-generating enzyme required for sulfatase activity
MQIKNILFSLAIFLVIPACTRPVQPAPTSQIPPAALPTLDKLDCNQDGQRWSSPGDGMELVCVPSGQFSMGSEDTDGVASSDEKPKHMVYLGAYWIDRTEITNAMFKKCVDSGTCHPRTYSPYMWGVASRTRKSYYDNPTFADYPVIMLDADEAQTYCQWVGRRLPSEAEWEKAARGSDSRAYPWGNNPPDCSLANFQGCVGDTAPVGSHPKGNSPYGAADMAGNLWEWVADKYDPAYYAISPSRNPTGPSSGDFRGLRGGSWGGTSLPDALRVANRASGKPEHWSDGEIGFRCALNSH